MSYALEQLRWFPAAIRNLCSISGTGPARRRCAPPPSVGATLGRCAGGVGGGLTLPSWGGRCPMIGGPATANSRPWVSTTICRLRPFTFLPASYPLGPLFPWSSPTDCQLWHRWDWADGPSCAALWEPGHHGSPAKCHPAARPRSSGRPIARAAGHEAANAKHSRCAERTGRHLSPHGGNTWQGARPV